MDKISNYIITKSTKSRCPKCYCNIHILYNDKYEIPSFFICFTCNKVWEDGVGECKVIDSTIKEKTFLDSIEENGLDVYKRKRKV
uniref:Uncharacterized protein n=1 Tax=viral metagenome TaxID=1070528 RepID=A0A6M3IU48_9ZZZZ